MSVVLYEKKDKIAYITLNRPEAMNAISSEVLKEITKAWIDVRDDPNIWVTVVTGAGDRAFSAGADLRDCKMADGVSKRGSHSLSSMA